MKKLLSIGLALVFITLLIASTNYSNARYLESKSYGSPLFKIRTSKTINEKIQNIKSKFLECRIFLNIPGKINQRIEASSLLTGPIKCPTTPGHCSTFLDCKRAEP